ncbi:MULTISPECIES: hypothetical protein [unclassified Virgibacillus]|uniref:hypothetical protein n=1 Tax=unclassified Virgibacillus TaxID=2620237 RepID=UPI0024DE887A|nr:hypothetical protein [Virgibacillus sp. LDC-1]
MTFTRVVYAENTYDLEEELNKVIVNETQNAKVTLKDIKFNSVFQGGAFGSEKVLHTAILIFTKTEN